LAMSNKMWFESEKITDAYVFPITPEKAPDKWKEFQSHQEMLDACRVPDEVLNKMSTKGLIETCLSYPLIGDMMFHNEIYQGFVKQTDSFNGLNELLNRKDAGNVLCDYYYNLSFDQILKTDKFPTFTLRYLEYIISQPVILDNLDETLKDELLSYAIKIAENKASKYSDTFTVSSTALIIGRILMNDEKFVSLIEKNENIKLFLETGTNFKDESWNDAFRQIKEGDFLS
ncbi:MAG: hypothetical protein PHV32_04315, partial [Eubacteriales bacterium]|nr:hypothetical protein [Eubacteriales bacterium]